MNSLFLLAFILLGTVAAQDEYWGGEVAAAEDAAEDGYWGGEVAAAEDAAEDGYWGGEEAAAEDAAEDGYWGGEVAAAEDADAAEYWGGEEAAAEDADADEYWGGDAAEECEVVEEDRFYCTDGDDIPANYVCDDYCDCMGCEDEVPCENGLGVTRIDLGGLSMALNLKHDGGQYGIMTTNLIGGIFYCILHPGDCLDF